jgi:hypothetical protein
MLNKIFETNNLENITVEKFQDSNIYIMDNFYKYPDEVLSYLFLTEPAKLWKEKETPSFNNIHFTDRRHNFYNEQFKETGIRLSTICNQPLRFPGTVNTNCIKFIDTEFNDYKNNYWGPHRDLGYNAIIYLNVSGGFTNLYEQNALDKWDTPEHFAPWRPKHKYQIIKQLDGKFNRLIMFDGAKFLHGMDISSNEFFNIHRINQVLFFN